MISFMMTLYSTRLIKSHTTSIRQCILMIENIEIQINYSNIQLLSLISSLSNNSNFNCLSFLNNINTKMTDFSDFNDVCDDVFNDKNVMNLFDNEDVELLKGFFSGLGKSDSNGQILNCKTYKEFFKNKLERLESEEKQKCKSQTAITVGLGLIFSIIVI